MAGTNNAVNSWKQSQGTGSPVGVVAGNIGDQYFDNVGFNLWQCSAAGSPATWVQMNGGGSSVSNAVIDVNAANVNTMSGTYNNGAAGVGATFTYGSTGTQTIDGQTVVLNGVYLIAGQATPSQNGVYLCTTAPATGVAGVLTRATNYNTPALIASNVCIKPMAGTQLGSSYIVLITSNITIGTTNLNYDLMLLIGVTSSGTTNALLSKSTGSLTTTSTSVPTFANNLTFVDSGSTSVLMVQNSSYLADAASALTSFSLPTTAQQGSVFEVQMNTFGTSTGWKITQNAGQQIAYGTSKTTAGTGGSLASSASGNSVTLKCVVANTSFQVIASQGNLTVV